MKTGKVRAVTGETYMLNQDEEMWAKELPPGVEELINAAKDPLADRSDHYSRHGKDAGPVSRTRDKTRVVTFRVPHNAAVQIYDYKEKQARVVFGPELVMLGPDEQFTQLSISGGKPKRPNVIKSLCLLLGPDFCTDIITVETADHARLSLQLSYNWYVVIKNNLIILSEYLEAFIEILCTKTAFAQFLYSSVKVIMLNIMHYYHSPILGPNIALFPHFLHDDRQF